MGKLDEADEQFRKALELKPNHYLAYFHLGVIYSKKDKKYNKAMEYFDLAIQYRPDHYESHFYKGLLEMKMGLYGDAIQSFLRCRELKKNKDEECEKKIKECTIAVNKILNQQYKNN